MRGCGVVVGAYIGRREELRGAVKAVIRSGRAGLRAQRSR